VRVIEDQTEAAARSEEVETPEADAPVDRSLQGHPGGFHVHAVPIDQPVGD
jgi:hypothetical protein